MDAAGHADPETAYTFREVAFSNIIHTNGVVFQNPVYTIEFRSSAIMNFFCKECAISSYGSLLWRLRAPLVAGHSNVIVSPAPEMVLEGISVASAGWDLPAGWVSEPLEIGPMFRSDMRAELTLREKHEPCQMFDALSFATPVLERR